MMNNQLNLVSRGSGPVAPFSISLESSFPFDLRLESLKGKRVIFRNERAKETIPLGQFGEPTHLAQQAEPEQFATQSRQRIVASVDSSCALVGETEKGAIYAARVSAVLAMYARIHSYNRLGPIIFYINPESVGSCPVRLISPRASKIIFLDRRLSERYIRVVLERWMQDQISSNLSDSIVVADGCLRSSVFEPRDMSFFDIERKCEENFNQFLGISKATSVRLVSDACFQLDSYNRGSVYLDVTDQMRAVFRDISCRVLAVKFSSNSTVFRVDSSRANAEDDSQVLADFRQNDIFFRGYPETLRLAHHLCVFDGATISSIRSYLSKKYDLLRVPSDDLRSSILGNLV